MERDISLVFYENTGSISSPSFVLRPANDNDHNPFFGLKSRNDNLAPCAADFDGDGDLDVLLGNCQGKIEYFENHGTSKEMMLIMRETVATNPFYGIDVGAGKALSKPFAIDLDNDGDLDLLVGKANNWFKYFENVGSAQNPGFTLREGEDDNPFHHLGATVHSSGSSSFSVHPTMADVTNDMNLDLIWGQSDAGHFKFSENVGGLDYTGLLGFADRQSGLNPFFELEPVGASTRTR